jgi:hypothetical protein
MSLEIVYHTTEYTFPVSVIEDLNHHYVYFSHLENTKNV